MGYTQYWEHEQLPAELFELIARDARIIVDTCRAGLDGSAPIGIAGWDGTGQPELTDSVIRLNGQGPDLDHETFMLSPEATEFAFCKTALKPYDLVVTAILGRAADLAMLDGVHFEIRSDGGHEGYAAGRALNDALFGASA